MEENNDNDKAEDIKTEEDVRQSLMKWAASGENDAVRLFYELKKQGEIEELKKELFGIE